MEDKKTEEHKKIKKLSFKERIRRSSSNHTRRSSVQNETTNESTPSEAKRRKKFSAPVDNKDYKNYFSELIQQDPGIYVGEIAENEDISRAKPAPLHEHCSPMHDQGILKCGNYTLGDTATSFIIRGDAAGRKFSSSRRSFKRQNKLSLLRNKDLSKSDSSGLKSAGKSSNVHPEDSHSNTLRDTADGGSKIGSRRMRKTNIFSRTAPMNWSGVKKKGAETGSSSSSTADAGRRAGRKHSLTRPLHRRPDRAAPSDNEHAGGGDSRGGSSEGAPSEAGDRVQAWATSFEKLLEDPVGLHTFTEFLRKEYSHENIYFWTACERYRLGISSDPSGNNNNNADSNKSWSEWSGKHAAAKTIYNTHLGDNAPEPVNVDAQARQMAQEGLRQPTQDLFAAAQKQVFSLMKFDSYSRFLKSALYEECLEREARGEDIQYGSQESLDPNLVILPSQLHHTSASDAQNANNVSFSSNSAHGSFASGLSCELHGSVDHVGGFVSSGQSSPNSLGSFDLNSNVKNSFTNLRDDNSLASNGSSDISSILDFSSSFLVLPPVAAQKIPARRPSTRCVEMPSIPQFNNASKAEIVSEAAPKRDEDASAFSDYTRSLKTASEHNSQSSSTLDVSKTFQKATAWETLSNRSDSSWDAEPRGSEDSTSQLALGANLLDNHVYSMSDLSSTLADSANALNVALEASSCPSVRHKKACLDLQLEIKHTNALLQSGIQCICDDQSPESSYTAAGLNSAFGDMDMVTLHSSSPAAASSVPAAASSVPAAASSVPAAASSVPAAASSTPAAASSTPAAARSMPAATVIESQLDPKTGNMKATKDIDHKIEFTPDSLVDGHSEGTPKSGNLKQIKDEEDFSTKLAFVSALVNELDLSESTMSTKINDETTGTVDPVEKETPSPDVSGTVPSIIVDTKFVKRNASKISRDSRRSKAMSLPSDEYSEHCLAVNNFEEIVDSHFQSIGESKLGSLSTDLLEETPTSGTYFSPVDNLHDASPANRARYDHLGLCIPNEEQARRLIESNKKQNLTKSLSPDEFRPFSHSKKSFETLSLSSFSRKRSFFKNIYSSFKAKTRKNSASGHISNESSKRELNSTEKDKHSAAKGAEQAPSRPYSLDGLSLPDSAHKSTLSSVMKRRKSSANHREDKKSPTVHSPNGDAVLDSNSVTCPYIANMQRERSFIRRNKTGAPEKQ